MLSLNLVFFFEFPFKTVCVSTFSMRRCENALVIFINVSGFHPLPVPRCPIDSSLLIVFLHRSERSPGDRKSTLLGVFRIFSSSEPPRPSFFLMREVGMPFPRTRAPQPRIDALFRLSFFLSAVVSPPESVLAASLVIFLPRRFSPLQRFPFRGVFPPGASLFISPLLLPWLVLACSVTR